MKQGEFEPDRFFPSKLFAKITDNRVDRPDLPRNLLLARRRRRSLTKDGKLALLAADHPARMVTSIRDDPLRMGRRHDLLARVLRVMACSPFDGVLGTADVLEDLVVASSFLKSPTELFDGKLLIGSVNRGGVAGSSFELDDRVTGYDVEGAVHLRLDGVKFLLRFDPDDPLSLRTIRYCVEVAKECSAARMPLFLEPLPVVRKDGKIKTDSDKSKLVKLVGVASAIGGSSSRVWLKLPYCEGFDEVAAATSLPILLLGGEASDNVRGLLGEIEQALNAGPNVRGVLMGRNLLYPPWEDPLPLAMAVNWMVHDGLGAEQAAAKMVKWSGKDLGVFRSND